MTSSGVPGASSSAEGTLIAGTSETVGTTSTTEVTSRCWSAVPTVGPAATVAVSAGARVAASSPVGNSLDVSGTVSSPVVPHSVTLIACEGTCIWQSRSIYYYVIFHC